MPPPRSRAPLFAVLGVLVLAGGGVAAWFATQGSKDKPAPVAQAPAEAPAVAPTPAPSPAPTPAPTPPPVETAPPPARTSVIVTISGVPEGTEVLVAGKPIGVAPGPVQLAIGSDPVVLTFRADGYTPASTTVVPDADKPLDITLKKRPRQTSGGTKPTRDDIIDVFGGKKK
jgi:glucose/arabinose dehydrogenase